MCQQYVGCTFNLHSEKLNKAVCKSVHAETLYLCFLHLGEFGSVREAYLKMEDNSLQKVAVKVLKCEPHLSYLLSCLFAFVCSSRFFSSRAVSITSDIWGGGTILTSRTPPTPQASFITDPPTAHHLRQNNISRSSLSGGSLCFVPALVVSHEHWAWIIVLVLPPLRYSILT